MLRRNMICEPEQHTEQGVAADCACHADDDGTLFEGAGGHPDDGTNDAEHEGNEQDAHAQDEERVIQDTVLGVRSIPELIVEGKIDLKKVHHEESGDEPFQDVIRAHHEERPQEYAEEQGHAKPIVACDVEH